MLQHVKALIIDMDGVLWRERTPVVDLNRLFSRIEALGLDYRLATNNSSRTPAQFQAELAKLGAILPVERVLTASQATAAWLHQRYPPGTALYIIGEDGLQDAMAEAGYRHDSHDAQAVVVGIDRGLTFETLKQATLLIRAGAAFIATNPDRTLPTPQGLMPGNGAQLAFLEAATDTKPVIIGKPQPFLFEVAMTGMDVTPQHTLAIGDRLETDIQGGQKAGCLTAVVLSGVSTAAQATAWHPAPDLICDNIDVVLDRLEEARHGSA